MQCSHNSNNVQCTMAETIFKILPTHHLQHHHFHYPSFLHSYILIPTASALTTNPSHILLLTPYLHHTGFADSVLQQQLWRRRWKWLGHTLRRSDEVLTSKHYSGHHKATEAEDDPGTLGEDIWRRKCGRQASGTAGGRWRWQLKTELDGVEWSVDYDPPGAIKHKSSHCFFMFNSF